jgi:hypothetical protein
MSGKSSDVGFDDLFDGPSFRTSLRLSQPQNKPKMWPKAATEMRRYTDFGSQGISALGDGDAYHKQMTQRGAPLSAVPAKIQRNHVSALKAQYRPSAGMGRATPAGKRAQPSADRRQWTWKDSSSA